MKMAAAECRACGESGTRSTTARLSCSAKATGVPVLLNTSFNLRGEPIVNTPENALNTFSKSELAALYIDDYVVRK